MPAGHCSGCAASAASPARNGTTKSTEGGQIVEGVDDVARSVEGRRSDVGSNDLSLQGGTRPKRGGDQSQKSDEKRTHLGNDDDLTNGAKTCIFQSGRGFRDPQGLSCLKKIFQGPIVTRTPPSSVIACGGSASAETRAFLVTCSSWTVIHFSWSASCRRILIRTWVAPVCADKMDGRLRQQTLQVLEVLRQRTDTLEASLSR